jgi:hypothetical protein
MSTEKKTGIELIADERARQISQEGWTPEHDDKHDVRELARAASAYVRLYVERAWLVDNELGVPSCNAGPKAYKKEEMHGYWPWAKKYWKPETPLKTLVKAGALIAAEIDRLNRKSQ